MMGMLGDLPSPAVNTNQRENSPIPTLIRIYP